MYGLNANCRAEIRPIGSDGIANPNGGSFTLGLQTGNQRIRNEAFQVSVCWIDNADVREVKLPGIGHTIGLPGDQFMRQIYGFGDFGHAIFFPDDKNTTATCTWVRLVGSKAVRFSFNLTKASRPGKRRRKLINRCSVS